VRSLFGLDSIRDGGVRIEVAEGAAFVPRLVRELSVRVENVTLRRPSLDDVFIKLTGHAIREEGADQLQQMRAFAQRWGGRR
jgi:ABC-2 type transport system ATP-binding protein